MDECVLNVDIKIDTTKLDEAIIKTNILVEKIKEIKELGCTPEIELIIKGLYKKRRFSLFKNRRNAI